MGYKICFLDRDTIRADIQVRRPSFDHEWQEYSQTQENEIVEHIADAEIVITNKVKLDHTVLQAAKNLKFIAVAATGTDHIDISCCQKLGITISNIRDYAITSVPEHVMSMALALRRQLLQYRSEVLNGRWQQENNFCFFDEPIQDLSGATLGIIGYGVLGQATARLASCMGMNILYTSRTKKESSIGKPVHLYDLLSDSDVVSCHCSLTTETRHLLNKSAFEKMKATAIVINTARGAIIDEQALSNAIIDQQIGGAGIDVLPEEPPAPDSPLMNIANYTNVILTPHIGWASQGAMQTLADQLIDNIEQFVKGTPRNIVTT